MNVEEIKEKLAFAYFYKYHLFESEVNHSKKELKLALNFWNQMKSALGSKFWENGKHHGDCAGVPMACMRCQFEEIYKVAEDIMDINYEDFLKEKVDE